jgi:lysophospholipase L1-like esterase
MKSFNKKVKDFNTRLKKYCSDNKFEYIELNENLSQNEMLLDSYTTDGLHLNMKAYIVWARELRNYF